MYIAADYPQFFTAEEYNYSDIPMVEFIVKHECLEECKNLISSVHLWGKKQNPKGRWIAHSGGLKSFLDDREIEVFMGMLSNFYDDGIGRYFVPEINASNEYVFELADLCLKAGIEFVEQMC